MRFERVLQPRRQSRDEPGRPHVPGLKRWQLATPQKASALFRSRGYVLLLVLAAAFGVPVSAASYLFLAAANKLQKWLYTMLPGQLGFHGVLAVAVPAAAAWRPRSRGRDQIPAGHRRAQAG